MRHVRVQAKLMIFTHTLECSFHKNTAHGAVCSCEDVIQKGDIFTVLESIEVDQRTYFVVLTGSGLLTFYCMTFERDVFFDVTQGGISPIAAAA